MHTSDASTEGSISFSRALLSGMHLNAPVLSSRRINWRFRCILQISYTWQRSYSILSCKASRAHQKDMLHIWTFGLGLDPSEYSNAHTGSFIVVTFPCSLTLSTSSSCPHVRALLAWCLELLYYLLGSSILIDFSLRCWLLDLRLILAQVHIYVHRTKTYSLVPF